MPYLQFLLVFQMCCPAANISRSTAVEANRSITLRQTFQDRWFAEDKVKHAMMSIAVVNFAHAGARFVGLQDERAVVIAALSGVAAGIWKEAFDQRMGRPFSGRDLVWDALGISLGLALVSNAR
jgi:uncharacterized protein YfiM (DUF2279 family)